MSAKCQLCSSSDDVKALIFLTKTEGKSKYMMCEKGRHNMLITLAYQFPDIAQMYIKLELAYRE